MNPKLTPRQERCLVALLEIEEEQRKSPSLTTRLSPGVYAGSIAWRLGFTSGPRQSGNGAKSRRSFSGYGASGKWVAGSLVGLGKKGLVRRYYADIRYRDRVLTNALTETGERLAKDLRASGVKALDPDAATANDPVNVNDRRATRRGY